jgi:hypothetical protein
MTEAITSEARQALCYSAFILGVSREASQLASRFSATLIGSADAGIVGAMTVRVASSLSYWCRSCFLSVVCLAVSGDGSEADFQSLHFGLRTTAAHVRFQTRSSAGHCPLRFGA